MAPSNHKGAREYNAAMCADNGGLRNIWFIFDNLVDKTEICLRNSLFMLNRNQLDIAQWKFKIETYYYKKSREFKL